MMRGKLMKMMKTESGCDGLSSVRWKRGWLRLVRDIEYLGSGC